jgi:hypothetical protein
MVAILVKLVLRFLVSLDVRFGQVTQKLWLPAQPN